MCVFVGGWMIVAATGLHARAWTAAESYEHADRVLRGGSVSREPAVL
jgi:hypothetical protein